MRKKGQMLSVWQAGLMFVAVTAGASSAAAEGWGLQYLAYEGGTRALQVERQEAQFAEAFIRDEARNGIYISCAKDLNGTRLFRFSSAGNPSFGRMVQVVLVSEDGHPFRLSALTYNRGAYKGVLRPGTLERLETSPRLTLRLAGEDGAKAEVTFAAGGLAAALADPSCAAGSGWEESQ